MSSHPTDPRHPWARLTAAARQVRDARDASAPYGFTTRVAALAFVQGARMDSFFDRFALRALGVAALLAVSSVALNYREITSAVALQSGVAVASNVEEVEPMPTDDAVALVLDLAD